MARDSWGRWRGVGGLEDSQRLLPTSSGREQGGELNGADLRIESQDWAGVRGEAHFASRVWGGRNGTALYPVQGVRVLLDGAGLRLYPPTHG